MLIRQEISTDYERVCDLVKRAFETAEHCDGNEQDLVAALRKSTAFLPELSLVAEADGKIVGHILFTKVTIDNSEELALAPLAVLPEYQRQGIGSALIQKGHEIARQLGFHYSIVLGSENYYPKMGYVPAVQYQIFAPFEVSPENFMAYRLCKEDYPISGTVRYAAEFGI